MAVGKHWGEITPPEVKAADISALGENMEVPDKMLAEPLKLLLATESDKEHCDTQVLPEESIAMDGVVLHTIMLLEHSRKMEVLLRGGQLPADTVIKKEDDDCDELQFPAIPEPPKREDKHTFSSPIRYMEKNFSPFSLGQGKSPPPVSPVVAREILRKSVATLIAHAGFETTRESVLDMLTDIGHDYLTKITQRLRVAVDREALGRSSGFPDCMEQVFHELGIGSMLTLHNFYQSRVIRYQQCMMKKCQRLVDEYKTLQEPTSLTSVNGERVKVKKEEEEEDEEDVDDDDGEEEEEEEEKDVPEIHFPALADGEGEELQPSLEPGFQMLQSLEQETQAQYQNLEPEEESINVSSSLSQGGQEVTLHIPEHRKPPVIESSQSTSTTRHSGKGKKMRKRKSHQ